MNKRRGLITGFLIGFLLPIIWFGSDDWGSILEIFDGFIIIAILTGCFVGIFGMFVGGVLDKEK